MRRKVTNQDKKIIEMLIRNLNLKKLNEIKCNRRSVISRILRKIPNKYFQVKFSQNIPYTNIRNRSVCHYQSTILNSTFLKILANIYIIKVTAVPNFFFQLYQHQKNRIFERFLFLFIF